jgi:capsular polysaccharide biosynthesis protein
MEDNRQQDMIVEEGITLSELIQIVWKNITLVILVTLWVTVLGVIYTYVVVDPTYTADTSIMVQVDITGGSTSEQSAIVIAQNLIATYKEFVVSNRVLQSVVEEIDALPASTNLKTLKSNITVSSSTSVLIIYIKVVNTDPALAKEIADKLVENSIAIANDENSGYPLLRNKLRLLDEAQIPVSPSAPNKMLNIVISFLLGGILSFGIIFVKELFNNKFQTTNDMEKYLGINVIAAVPGTIKERKLVD